MSASEGTSVRKHSMVETKSRWKSVAGREKWAARGASLVAKTKATKVVWFPPKPVENGKKSAATAKKRFNGAKKVTSPLRKKKA